MTTQSPAAPLEQLRNLLQTGDLEQAAGLSDQIQRQFPAEPEAFRLGARAALRSGEYASAIRQAACAVELRPRNVALRLLLAEAQFLEGDIVAGLDQVHLVEESAGKRAGALRQTARFHRRFGQPARAYVLLLRALAAEPESAQAVSDAGILAWHLGKHEEARALARRLWRLEPSRDEAVLLRSLATPATPDLHHIEALNFLLSEQKDKAGQEAEASPALCQAIGRELEDLEQFEPAFVSYLEASSRRAARQGKPQWVTQDGVQAVEERFSRLESDSILSSGEQVPIVFIIGLDCSLTRDFAMWLAERPGLHDLGAANPVQRVIDRVHPQAHMPWAETEVADLSRGVNSWLSAYPDKDQWCLDSTRGQYLRLGLLMSAFPDAKFIHFRRHPLDQCLDLMCPEPGSRMTDPASLDDLADHYTAYHRLMGHWRRRFSPSMLELDADHWVADAQAVDRQLAAYLDLDPLDQADLPASLRPGERVGRADRFARQLEPLAKRLEANGIPLTRHSADL